MTPKKLLVLPLLVAGALAAGAQSISGSATAAQSVSGQIGVAPKKAAVANPASATTAPSAVKAAPAQGATAAPQTKVAPAQRTTAAPKTEAVPSHGTAAPGKAAPAPASTSNSAAAAESIFSAGEAGFSLRYKNEVTSLKYSPIFLLPNDEISLRVEENASHRNFLVQIDGGALKNKGLNTWTWSAPAEPGLYAGQILSRDHPDTMRLQIFVMTPRSAMKDEYIDGYLIGHYPAVALRDLDVYRPPEGFIKVTKENQNTPLTPHFTLSQFLCKQQGGFPKYVVLQERLLYKLEHLLQKVNEKGYACQTFAVMSGYRTPAYNRRIGNRKYSQHCYGGAADIYIDADPVDSIMDDLNKDGRQDYADAGALFKVVEWVSQADWFAPYIGGLARYRATRAHGPFIHVDVRGFSAHWGD